MSKPELVLPPPAEVIAIFTRRTLTRTRAPIFSSFRRMLGSEIHAPAHAAHTTAAHPSHTAGAATLFGPLGHHRFRGDHQRRDGSRVLQRRTHDLGRIDDAGAYQILELS